VVRLGLVGGHRDGRPAVQTHRRQRLGGLVAQVGDLERRRRLGSFRAHQGGLESGVRAQPGDRQRGRIAAQHHQLRHGLEAAAEGAVPGRRRALRRIAGAPAPVADPLRGLARVAKGEQPPNRRVVGRDPLDQDVDPRATEQPDVRPWAAGPVDEAARLAVRQAGFGVAGDVGLQAAAGKEPGEDPLADHHLRADRPRPAAIERDDGGEGAGPASRPRLSQRRARIVAEAEHRPVGQHPTHPRSPFTLSLNLRSTSSIRLLKGRRAPSAQCASSAKMVGA